MLSPVRPTSRDDLIETAVPDAAEDVPRCQDRELVVQAQHDRRAFAPLYHRYVDPVHRYCYRRLGDRAAAEDATSQVFTRALGALGTYREQPGGSFQAWVFTIAHHVVTDALRRRRPTVSLDLAGDVADAELLPEELVIAGETTAAIQDLLMTLPPVEQRVIELRLAGLTGPEIAVVLGRSRNAVNVAQSRAVARLRHRLGHRPSAKGTHHAGR